MKQGRLFIFSSPSGAGKSTVIHQILQRHPDFFPSLPPRVCPGTRSAMVWTMIS